jgi:transposase InsO family protein
LEELRRQMPFAIQKLQCDNGSEFPLAFTLAIEAAGIRHRYIKPRRPQQNGSFSLALHGRTPVEKLEAKRTAHHAVVPVSEHAPFNQKGCAERTAKTAATFRGQS